VRTPVFRFAFIHPRTFSNGHTSPLPFLFVWNRLPTWHARLNIPRRPFSTPFLEGGSNFQPGVFWIATGWPVLFPTHSPPTDFLSSFYPSCSTRCSHNRRIDSAVSPFRPVVLVFCPGLPFVILRLTDFSVIVHPPCLPP